jgi:hypothetical protein
VSSLNISHSHRLTADCGIFETGANEILTMLSPARIEGHTKYLTEENGSTKVCALKTETHLQNIWIDVGAYH